MLSNENQDVNQDTDHDTDQEMQADGKSLSTSHHKQLSKVKVD
jgi:hypothetical protein